MITIHWQQFGIDNVSHGADQLCEVGALDLFFFVFVKVVFVLCV